MRIVKLFQWLIISAVLFTAIPAFALPFHPDDAKRYMDDGTFKERMQEWVDFKEANPMIHFNPDEIMARPEQVESIKEVLRGVEILPQRDSLDLNGNGMIDERDFLELGYPVDRSAQMYYSNTKGEQKSLVILVEFNNRQGNPNRGSEYFDDLLFSNEGRWEPSMRDYYQEVSNGQLDCVGTVVDSGENGGWLRINARARDYYGYGKVRDLVSLAVDLADPYVDFSEYDNTGNNVVDSLMVVVAGNMESGQFWPHKWYLQTPKYVDGVYIYPYFLATEDSAMGVFAHEHGHAMGLPDLYDYSGDTYGVGYWCLMAYGCWGGDGKVPVHMSAWCKLMMGWVDIIDIEESIVDAPIPGTPGNSHIYKLSGNLSGNVEYFLVENRRKQSYDRRLPGEGVLIWHVNLWGQQDNSEFPFVALMQADGHDDLKLKNNTGDTTDPYYFESGNYTFTKDTYPNSNTAHGHETGISIERISTQGDIMYAFLKNKPTAVEGIDTIEPGSIEPRR